MKKKCLSLLLTVTMLFGLVPSAYAADSKTESATEAADALYELGLFAGTGTDAAGHPIYSLDQAMTRESAVTMLVRLLGKEEEARTDILQTPFTDVSTWAKPYVGYAYAHHLTAGTSTTTFDGKSRVTASQYLSFVLRALGYTSGSDFQWNAAWRLSDKLGVTHGQYTAQNNKDFLRGDAAIVSHASLEVPLKGTNTPLISQIPTQKPIKPSEPTKPTKPVDMNKRVLSDAELAALQGKGPAEIKSAISTVADARAFLNKRFPSLWHSYHLWQGQDSNIFVLRAGADVLCDDTAGRSDMATIMTYLLDDDYNISSVYGFWALSGDEPGPLKAANCIQSGNQYFFFDPVIGMTADQECRRDPLLPEATVASMDAYAELFAQNSSHYDVDSLYVIPGGQELNFTYKSAWVTMNSPSIAPIYTNEEHHLTDEEYEEQRYGHIKAENIGRYKLSTLLGGLTLSPEEAKALVGKSPEVLKEKIHTAGDLLEYMLAARTLLKNGDEGMSIDGEYWHYNSSAKQTLQENLGNCGRMANVANYLLEGDYEEIGFVLHSYYPNNGGGHVYNYIKYQGKYYIVDFSSYLFNNYNVSQEFNFIAMDRLEDYGTRWRECYGNGLAAVVVHTSTGTHLPNVWRGDGYYFPEGADFKVLYETPGTGYEVRTLPLDTTRLDWHHFE